MISKQQDKCINLSNSELTNVGIYSISHALIDGCCAAIIAANIALGKYDLGILSYYIVLYNIVAFALQAPVGLIVDKL
ncbi:hypothetical protein I6U48_24650 [Clostridium sp. PL3]|uniref:Uncharacterized protein n=1 Tax=Clostridium thailandense TaxID=2794346 RepID=A0A949TNG1_9CLOT|nr:hypothetical protein [Clostridium thailandense]MBV7276084.1 hypothetical protein [Clostridium thailandense]